MLSEAEWLFAKFFFGDACAYCKKQAPLDSKLEQDLFIPLVDNQSPGAVRHNIVPCCEHCKKSKRNSDPYAWLNKRFHDIDYQTERVKLIQDYFALVNDDE